MSYYFDYGATSIKQKEVLDKVYEALFTLQGVMLQEVVTMKRIMHSVKL